MDGFINASIDNEELHVDRNVSRDPLTYFPYHL